MRHIERVLAVVGAVALLVLVVTAGLLFAGSRPASQGPGAGPSAAPPGSPAAPAIESLGGDDAWAQGTQLASDRILTSSGELRDVVLVTRGFRKIGGKISATQVAVDATVPFDTVERQVGQDVDLGHDGSGRVRIQGVYTVLGRSFDVSGVGTVEAAGDAIVVRPVSVRLPLPDLVSGPIERLVLAQATIREPVPGLPPGLTVSSLAVGDDGFRVRLSGADVDLSR
ncbi:LmeA family phospholipid-binding protein [Agilicoccus flavus]|uniref:LmeA family phospholipid-binding protein n=1 Tax=Agilicoccus flavus TaxID=2775968 RepID=UPI001CF6F527|nr:LmeA family phospholipid-binding protein [Agilicoccus flavus]